METIENKKGGQTGQKIRVLVLASDQTAVTESVATEASHHIDYLKGIFQTTLYVI